MNNWFTNSTQSAGTGVKNLLDGILSPTTSAANNLLGTNTTTVTEAPNQSNSKTGTIVIAALAVITLIVVGVILFKKASKQ